MAEHIHPAKHDGAFAWADDVSYADRECGHVRATHKRQCGVCRRSALIHCPACMIQVTGCLCTWIERMGPMEAYKAVARQVGQTQAREEFAALGYNLPLLPNIPF